VAADDVPSRAVWTVPNGLSVLRLLGVPLFLVLALGPEEDGWAIVVLMVGGFTDYLDGKLARAWGQTSRIGQLLDPLADRLYIVAVVVALVLRGVLPLWVALVLAGRDVLLVSLVPLLRTRNITVLPVHFLGKAATFNLLYAFPLLLLGVQESVVGQIALPIGWAFVWWGAGLYWLSALAYAVQVADMVRQRRAQWQAVDT
jgi:cardiolipin synthase